MKVLFRIIDSVFLFAAVNSFCFIQSTGAWVAAAALAVIFLVINIIPSPRNFEIRNFRLRVCAEGSDLLSVFLVTSIMSAVYHIASAFFLIPDSWKTWMISAGICVLCLAVVFWNGIIRVYCTSVQLGVKQRVIGILCGWIPIANVCALCSIIKITSKEAEFENNKIKLNQTRAREHICATKYPILLVHGVFFRDFKYPKYWGRIPKELEKNGAVIFYGNHQSALSVADSGAELSQRIQAIVRETGCEKVNIIAHSKGGLDCRYAISRGGASPYVASLTTINTPHRGCLFADYLLGKVPLKVQQTIANTYNSALKKLGDSNPDFIAAVKDLTAENCSRLNKIMPDSKDVIYMSVGSKLNRAVNGKFPLNFSYHLVKYFSGANDGLVSEDSFPWGQSYIFLTVNGKRGISHGDMIDLNRENIDGFDVREFYVNRVAELKKMGL